MPATTHNVPKAETNGRVQNYEQPPPQESQQIVREITLTDKLNKKLLESFLVRINENTNQFANEENSEEVDTINRENEFI